MGTAQQPFGDQRNSKKSPMGDEAPICQKIAQRWERPAKRPALTAHRPSQINYIFSHNLSTAPRVGAASWCGARSRDQAISPRATTSSSSFVVVTVVGPGRRGGGSATATTATTARRIGPGPRSTRAMVSTRGGGCATAVDVEHSAAATAETAHRRPDRANGKNN